jgi:flavin reductase (DIM6/NTAB) family NADH-FMN oxidoreductase RutF
MSVTSAEFRQALGCFATGVTVITVDDEGQVQGMTANAFASVSLDPPLVLVCVDHRARTHAHLHAKKRFGVNVLAEDQQIISEYYARAAQDHGHAERDASARFDRTAHGTPVLNGALAYLECLSQKSKKLWSGRAIRCFTTGPNTGPFKKTRSSVWHYETFRQAPN